MKIQPFFSHISNTDKKQNILDGANDILDTLLYKKNYKEIIRPNNKDLIYIQNEINSKTINLWTNYKLLMNHCIQEASKNIISLESCIKKLRNIESQCDLLKGMLDIFKNGNNHIDIVRHFAKFNNEHVKEMQAIIKNHITFAQNNIHPRYVLANAIHQFIQPKEEEYKVNINIRMTI